MDPNHIRDEDQSLSNFQSHQGTAFPNKHRIILHKSFLSKQNSNFQEEDYKCTFRDLNNSSFDQTQQQQWQSKLNVAIIGEDLLKKAKKKIKRKKQRLQEQLKNLPLEQSFALLNKKLQGISSSQVQNPSNRSIQRQRYNSNFNVSHQQNAYTFNQTLHNPRSAAGFYTKGSLHAQVNTKNVVNAEFKLDKVTLQQIKSSIDGNVSILGQTKREEYQPQRRSSWLDLEKSIIGHDLEEFSKTKYTPDLMQFDHDTKFKARRKSKLTLITQQQVNLQPQFQKTLINMQHQSNVNAVQAPYDCQRNQYFERSLPKIDGILKAAEERPLFGYKQPIIKRDQDESLCKNQSKIQIAFGTKINFSPSKASKESSPCMFSPPMELETGTPGNRASLIENKDMFQRKVSPKRATKRLQFLKAQSNSFNNQESPLVMSPLKHKKASQNDAKGFPMKGILRKAQLPLESTQTATNQEYEEGEEEGYGFIEENIPEIDEDLKKSIQEATPEEEKTLTYKPRGSIKNALAEYEETLIFNHRAQNTKDSLFLDSTQRTYLNRRQAPALCQDGTSKQNTCMIIKTHRLDQIRDYPSNETRIIYYKDSRILHHSLFKDFEQEIPRDLILQRATENQVIVESSETQPRHFEDPREIEDFLRQHSKLYSKVLSIDQIGKGGESVVFRLITMELEEIVAKCPILKLKDKQEQPHESLNFFQTTLYENQLLKVRPHSDFLAQIKEEVIEYNKERGLIIRYIAIMEQAQNDLSKLVEIWSKKEERTDKREHYSDQKLAYYCLQSMKTLDYLHSRNIYYGDMKPENLLIFRNQQVKLGDFGICIKMRNSMNNEKGYPYFYKSKGYTKNYSLEYMQKFNCFVSKTDLILNDRFGLWKTFSSIYQIVQQLGLAQGGCMVSQMIEDLDIKNSQKMTFHEVVVKYIKIFCLQQDFAIKLSTQLLDENKSTAIREVLKITRYGNYVQGLVSLAKSQRNNQIQASSPRKIPKQVKPESPTHDQGEQIDFLHLAQDKFGDFDFKKIREVIGEANFEAKGDMDYFKVFPLFIEWKYDLDKTNFDFEDQLWKDVILLLLESCDNRHDVCLKYQIKKRCHLSFKYKAILRDIDLNEMQQSQIVKIGQEYTPLQLLNFFSFLKFTKPHHKNIYKIENQIKLLGMKELLVQIYQVIAQKWFDAQDYESCEQKARQALEISRELNDFKIQIDSLTKIAYCVRRRLNDPITVSQIIIECSSLIEKYYSKSSLQYHHLLIVKSMMYQDQNKFEEALNCENQCQNICYNLLGKNAGQTQLCFKRVGLLCLKMKKEQAVITLEKYAKMFIHQLDHYIYLFEAYCVFEKFEKLKMLTYYIKEAYNENDLVYLAFASSCFDLEQNYDIHILSPQEKKTVICKLLNKNERWQQNLQIVKYPVLLKGFLNFCQQTVMELTLEPLEIESNLIEQLSDEKLIDRKKKMGHVEKILSRWTERINPKLKTQLP